jgi:hypothetical protein
MAYTSGDTILDDHYNIFVQGGASAVDHNTANVNTVWGSGTGDKGYGQSGTLATVSAGSTITATQWVNLLNRVSSLANHQGTTITSISNPTTGDTISAYTALSGNISSVFTNRLNCAASGSDITAGGTSSGTNTWRDLQTTTFTVSFASANAARYYFNAGGRIALSFSRSGGTVSSKNTGWTNLCTACGTLYFSGGSGTATIAGGSYTGTNKSGGSGSTTTLATTTGWYDLTTSYVEVFKQYDSTYLYTANYIKVEVARNATSTQYLVKVSFVDAADSTGWADGTFNDGGAQLDETIDGTLTATMTLKPPATTYLSSASWGTPTMSATAMGGDTYV